MRFDVYVYNSPLGRWADRPIASVQSTVSETLLTRAAKAAAQAFGERWVAVYDTSRAQWVPDPLTHAGVWDTAVHVVGVGSRRRLRTV